MTARCVYVKQQKFWNHAGFTELKMQKNDYIIVGRLSPEEANIKFSQQAVSCTQYFQRF